MGATADEWPVQRGRDAHLVAGLAQTQPALAGRHLLFSLAPFSFPWSPLRFVPSGHRPKEGVMFARSSFGGRDVAESNAHRLVGKNYTTPDLVAKVTGKAKYAEDYQAD